MSLKPGDTAPDFTLPSTVGDKVTLSSYQGKKSVILLFYPLDFSPVCSVETKECEEMLPSKGSADVEVLGISVDSLWAHKAFAAQQGITYPLLADFHPKGAVAETSFASWSVVIRRWRESITGPSTAGVLTICAYEPAERAIAPPLPIFISTLWTMVPTGMLASGIALPGLTSTWRPAITSSPGDRRCGAMM